MTSILKFANFIFSFLSIVFINAGEIIQIASNVFCLTTGSDATVLYSVNISTAALCLLLRLSYNTWHILFSVISLSLNIYIYSSYVKSGLEIIFVGWTISTTILLGVLKEVLRDRLQTKSSSVFPVEMLLEKH